MWLGEQITERGIGNGISLVITVGIIARVDQAFLVSGTMFFPASGEGAHARLMACFCSLLLLTVVGVVIAVTQAMRKIPVQYAQRQVGRKMMQGGSTYFPLRVNYAGVMPIIFAQAILMFPAQIFGTVGRWLGEGNASDFFIGLGDASGLRFLLEFSHAVADDPVLLLLLGGDAI